jgi:hypothetical protein
MRNLIFTASLLTVLAFGNTANAQILALEGDWTLNVPQIPGLSGTPVWTFTDAGGVFNGTTTFNVTVTPNYNASVNGTMSGTSVFSVLFIGTATYDSTPNLYDSLVSYVLFVKWGNTLTGVGLDTLSGLPISAPYPVSGTPYVPPTRNSQRRR